MSDFKPGDIVKLKCSPQKMAVEAQNGPLKFICVWIEDYGTPHRETYNSAVLMLDDGEAELRIKRAMKK